MNKYLAGYVGAALVMLALDAVWLGLVAKSTYQAGIGHLMAAQPVIPAAAVFYIVYAAGLMVFAVAPQAEDAGWTKTLVMGALFGFFAYATYDLSNLATLKDWPVRLTVIDMAWGTLISAASACAGKAAMNWAART